MKIVKLYFLANKYNKSGKEEDYIIFRLKLIELQKIHPTLHVIKIGKNIKVRLK